MHDGSKYKDEPVEPKYITQQQEKQIKEGLTSVGGDPDKFLKWLKADSFQKILASDYTRAMAQINKKADENAS